MAINLKKLSAKPDLLAGGHAACAGCTGPTVLRQALLAAETPVVTSSATGCMEVVTTLYPHTAWRVPFIHSAFENSAATMSGIETAYRALRKRGKIPDREIGFIAFGGDGGTYDIGLQSLSGALERGHKMLYICYDNEAYMNTGIQRSSSTPKGADTTTAPAGKVKAGKEQNRKDLTAIVIAHNPAYVAQASPSNAPDFMAQSPEGAQGERRELHQRHRAVPPRLALQAGTGHRDGAARRGHLLLAALRVGAPRQVHRHLQAEREEAARGVAQGAGALPPSLRAEEPPHH